jgi:hypothetical protein
MGIPPYALWGFHCFEKGENTGRIINNADEAFNPIL